MQATQHSWRQRCKNYLTHAAALVALCGFGFGGVQQAGAQMLDNISHPEIVSGKNNSSLMLEANSARGTED